MHEEEPGTFYLTDFLVRHFDRLIVKGLGLDRHPELFDDYFRHYRRVVWLAQSPTPDLADARRAARPRSCKLPLAVHETGFGLLESEVLKKGRLTWPRSPSSTGVTSRPRSSPRPAGRPPRPSCRSASWRRSTRRRCAPACSARTTISPNWRRGDPSPAATISTQAVADKVATIDAAYDAERLRRLIEAGGAKSA